MIHVDVFWVVIPRSEDGGSKALRDVGILTDNYTVLQAGRPWLESSPPWKPQIS